MTALPKSTIKSYFLTGDKPTQSQFGDLVDSYADFGSSLTALTGDVTITAPVSGSAVATISSAAVTGSKIANNTITTANIYVSAKSGTANVLVTVSGAITAGHYAIFDANGNVVDGGSGASGGLIDVQVFVSSGTSTWIKPAGTNAIEIWIVGGGGGGSGTGGNGGAGGGSYKYEKTSILSTETVTIGVGGTGATSGAAGAGGTSSFGSHCSSTGGFGAGGTGNVGGLGGTGSGGLLNITGVAGGEGFGGSPPFAFGTPSTITGNGNSGNGLAQYGGGGTVATGGTSNNGAAGICMIKSYT